MMRVLSCLEGQHRLWLVALAAVLCLATSLTSIRLYVRALASRGTARAGWVLMAGVATGAGVWATHFLAVLGYDPGLPTAHSAALTALSLIIATVSMTGGCALAVSGSNRLARYAGGAIIGAGIGAMHFAGMAALRTQGSVHWDADLVILSVGFGVVLASLAFGMMRNAPSLRLMLLGGASLTAAVIALHFTAMGAITITPDPAVAVPPKPMPDFLLALSVTTVALLILGAGNAMYLVRAETGEDANRRFHAFADAATDGVVIVDGGNIVHVNENFCRLLQCERESLIGAKLLGTFLNVSERAAHPDSAVMEEGTLKAGQGAEIPVEVLARPAPYEGRIYHIYALRDLREKRHAQFKIRFLAEHDALTGLANRTLFQSQLQQAMAMAGESRTEIAVFLIDLDRLRDVNDIFGHAAGDAILRGVGTRLRALAREGSLCARLGGDEFALMQAGSSPGAADTLAREILAAITSPFIFGGARITLGCCAGVALYPHDGRTAHELFAHAETALHRAKMTGRGSHCFFEPALDEQIHERRALAFDLSNAIAGNQLEVYYQPLSAVPSMEIMGFEALLRWNHPTRGMISPAVFIPIAEETQIIRELGAWTLRTVCQEAAGWPNPLKVSVNLSAVQLEDTQLPELVQETLFTTGMAAARLELEVTETALMRNPQRALDVLRRLKALGIRIAMDDFGTGYSSLSTLQAFPFDKIKIDKSFVERVDTHGQAASIVKAVLGLGRSLHIPVLVEGVETERQLDFLKREGAEEIQGYLVGRPQPVATYRALLHGVEAKDADGGISRERRA